MLLLLTLALATETCQQASCGNVSSMLAAPVFSVITHTANAIL